MDMGSKRRNAIASWALVLVTLALAAFRLPEADVLRPALLSGMMVLVVALLLNLGLPMTHRTSTFLPVVALTAYLSLGLSASLWVMVVGLGTTAASSCGL